jgi:hypothetical protein
MNNKLLVGTMRLAIIAGLLIVIAGGHTTNAQVEENLSFNFATWAIDYSKGNRVEILVNTPDSQKFLSDPINTLKRQGVAVPRAAEAPWRGFTGALRRLATSHRIKAKGSRRSSKNKEILFYSFDKITVLGTIAGDWNGDGTTTVSARKASAGFLDDPLATLRAGRVEVPAADERAWRQLAEALKELHGVYSRIGTKRNAEGQQAPSELNGRTGVEGTQAVAPRGWDPKKKIEVTGSSETSQEQASAGDPDRPVILGSTPNSENSKVVGTCNTTRGCAALKDACKSLQKHSFKATAADKSLGVCTVHDSFSLRSAVGRVLAAPVTTSEATINCFGTLFCGKVKKICAALGGDYRPIYNQSGTCQY